MIMKNLFVRWDGCPFLKKVVSVFVLSILLGCNGNNNMSDAYGNFEAVEIVVSSENSGILKEFNLNEGDKIEENQRVALIDTVMPFLNLRQLMASKQSAAARLIQLQKTIEVKKTRLEVLHKEVVRVSNLHEDKAVPTQKYDEVTGQYDVARKELEQVRSNRLSLQAEIDLAETRIEAAEEQLRRCVVIAPTSGTVLQKYAEKGELATHGKPLFKMAETRELVLRAYVSGHQLDDFSVGDEVSVKYDKNKDSEHETNGIITWVSSTAEFTPKIIQTKEERVDLVYAIKVLVQNPEGRLKIGMPGEVVF
jgi:HlyD family secretion protein